MKATGQVVVVTGGAGGIGRALAQRFHRDGAKAVVIADIDEAGAVAVAKEIGGLGLRCDVGREPEVAAMIEETEWRFGPIGLFCSNAGIAAGFDLHGENIAGASDADWARSWAINVMSHVYAVRTLVPRMKARGGGYFLITVSAAGLLSQIGSATYSTSKHAAVGFAESLAIAHRADNVRVSILCPQGVDTAMLRSLPKNPASFDGVLTAEDVAAAASAGIERESFLILPHPEVETYMRRKTENYDRWIGGMAKLLERTRASGR